MDLSSKVDVKESSPISLVLAESYPLLLDGLEQAFRSEPGFRVLCSCTQSEEALRAVARHRPDVFLLGLETPEDVLDILKHLTSAQLPTRVVLLAGSLDDLLMLEAVRLGAKGIFLKSMGRPLLIQCIRKVHRGSPWLERATAGRAVEQLLIREQQHREVAAIVSVRELEIVRLVVAGHSNRQIAERLVISEGTVKAHLHHVYEKLNLRGRLELTLYARDRGLFRNPKLVSGPLT